MTHNQPFVLGTFKPLFWYQATLFASGLRVFLGPKRIRNGNRPQFGQNLTEGVGLLLFHFLLVTPPPVSKHRQGVTVSPACGAWTQNNNNNGITTTSPPRPLPSSPQWCKTYNGITVPPPRGAWTRRCLDTGGRGVQHLPSTAQIAEKGKTRT